MSTISLRLEEKDYKLLQKYISTNNLNLSDFVREAIMDKIEDAMNMDEKYILKAYKKSLKEPSYDINKVWGKSYENIKK